MSRYFVATRKMQNEEIMDEEKIVKRRKSKQEETYRAMPYNMENEEAVLCSCLIDNDVADSYIPVLKVEDFYVKAHKTIFESMQELQRNSIPVDTVSLADNLMLLGKIEEIGGISYLGSLSNFLPSSANIQHYVDMLKRDSLLRVVIKTGVNITENAYRSTSGETALQFAESELYQIAQEQSPTALTQVATACLEAVKEIEDIQTGVENDNYVRTGFPHFDELTHGLKPGEMILLAARPGVGKTAFALNIAANVAVNDRKSVAMFSLEMPTVQLVRRMLSYIGGFSNANANTPKKMSTVEFKKMYNAYKQLSNANFFVDDYSLNTPADILSKCRRMKREHGLDLIVLDYLQLMETPEGESFEGRQQEVSKMSRKMKIYAKELGVPILVLSQMSRGVEQRIDHEPKLSDLRDSGAIEQDADMVMFLHNPSKYVPDLPKDIVKLVIAKHRNGKLETIDLKWTGETSTFVECEIQGDSAVMPTSNNQEVADIPRITTDENGNMQIVKPASTTENIQTNDEPPVPPEKPAFVNDMSDDVPPFDVEGAKVEPVENAISPVKRRRGLISPKTMPVGDFGGNDDNNGSNDDGSLGF